MCFHSDGRGSSGCGIPVHYNSWGNWPPAVVSGAEPDLPVWSSIMEEESEPCEGEDIIAVTQWIYAIKFTHLLNS